MASIKDEVDDAESQAVRWLMKLDSDPTSDLNGRHQAWLSESLRHRIAHVKHLMAWKRSDVLLRRLRPLDGKVDPDLLKRRAHWPNPFDWSSQHWLSAWPRAAACAVLVAMVAGLASIVVTSTDTRTYSTGVGGLQHVVLDDGSIAQLNTRSRIRVRFTDSRRTIIVDEGEALFSVVHNPTRPFDVIANGTTVRAVGTQFSVRLREDKRVEALVKEGRVLVLQPKSVLGIPIGQRAISPTLAAGDTAVVDRDSVTITHSSPDEIQRRLMWTEGKILFRGETLAEVVQELNRYSPRQLELRDASVAAQRIGGTFDTSDPESFIEALVAKFGVQYKRR